MIESCEAPSQQTRSSRGTWIVMFADGAIADLSHFWPILPTAWRVGMPHESTPHRAADEETNHKSDHRTDTRARDTGVPRHKNHSNGNSDKRGEHEQREDQHVGNREAQPVELAIRA